MYIHSLSTPVVVHFVFDLGSADSEGSRTELGAGVTAWNPMAKCEKLSPWLHSLVGLRSCLEEHPAHSCSCTSRPVLLRSWIKTQIIQLPVRFGLEHLAWVQPGCCVFSQSASSLLDLLQLLCHSVSCCRQRGYVVGNPGIKRLIYLHDKSFILKKKNIKKLVRYQPST